MSSDSESDYEGEQKELDLSNVRNKHASAYGLCLVACRQQFTKVLVVARCGCKLNHRGLRKVSESCTSICLCSPTSSQSIRLQLTLPTVRAPAIWQIRHCTWNCCWRSDTRWLFEVLKHSKKVQRKCHQGDRHSGSRCSCGRCCRGEARRKGCGSLPEGRCSH